MYQYEPQNLPYTLPTDAVEVEQYWLYGYLAMSFIIFSIAVAVVRNLYRAHVGKTNIKKQIKKRFRKVFGDENGNIDNGGLMNNDPDDGNYPGPEESKVPSNDERDPKGSVAHYLRSGVGKVMGKFGKKNDAYEDLKGLNPDQNTHVWGPAGLKEEKKEEMK
jgi:hypothetical protein